MSICLVVTGLALALAAPLPGPPHPPVPALLHVGQPPPTPKPPPAKPGKPGLVGAPTLPGGGKPFIPGDASRAGGVTGVSVPGSSPLGGATTTGSSGTPAGAHGGVVRGAATATGRFARGNSGRARVDTPATSGQSGLLVLDTWQQWWLHNRDEFLDIKARKAEVTTVSGSPGHLLGRGRRGSRPSGHRPAIGRMDHEVVPALLDLMTRHKERELLNAAALAVGRMASAEMAQEVQDGLTELLAHDERQIQASAALGLGALGEPAADRVLLALLRDDSQGRRLVGGGRVDRLPRSISALSLGLLGHARSAWSLLDVVRRLPDSEVEVKACAVAALGLMPPDSPRTAVVCTVLLDMLDERGLDPEVASVIPTTLAKLGAREALPRLVQIVRDRQADRLLRQSAAIALGRLASLDDDRVVDTLIEQVRDGRDASTRQFALIALGRAGAAGGSDPEVHRTVRLLYEREFSGLGRKRQRTWAALAAGIHGRVHEPTRAALLPGLRDAHDDANDPEVRAAFALALGLLQDTASTETLRVDLLDSDQELSGFAAVALGLLDDRESISALRSLLHRNGSSPSQRVRISTSLALLADVEAVPGLVELLRSGVTYDEQVALSKAIGLIGDERAIAPLLELALDESAKLHDRGFACVALGLLGERTRLPFQAALRAGTNYLARIDPLVQVAELL